MAATPNSRIPFASDAFVRMSTRLVKVAFALCCLSATVNAASWQSTITSSAPPSFPNPRPMHARYGFGWSGFPGATADIRLNKPSSDRLQLDVSARTIGLVRALWKFDATHTSIVESSTLRPLTVRQFENDRAERRLTDLSFSPEGVVSKVTETPGNGPKVRRFDFPRLFDLQSAVLYLRSQLMQEGNVHRIVVYSATAPYLATVTVLGRERITVPAGKFNAIKFDLQLNRIKDGELQPHRKFRRATAWVSDDADRLFLRIEAQVFVGAVFAELQSVEFEGPKG